MQNMNPQINTHKVRSKDCISFQLQDYVFGSSWWLEREIKDNKSKVGESVKVKAELGSDVAT